jgi:hypothetical protein
MYDNYTISFSQITYSIYLNDYFESVKEYTCHINKIFLSAWMKFSYLCGGYFVYMTKVFFKIFVLLTKVKLMFTR